jgi:hypothetical protein
MTPGSKSNRTDGAVEMSKNGRMPETQKDFTEMIKQMDSMGLKGP